MLDLKTLRIDGDKKDNGAWLDLGGAKIKVRSLRSKIVSKEREKLQKPFAKRIQRGTLSDDEAADIGFDLFANAVVVDWEGIAEGDKAIECTPEEVRRVLVEYEGVADEIADFARNDRNFLDDSIEEGIEDLKKPLTGSAETLPSESKGSSKSSEHARKKSGH